MQIQIHFSTSSTCQSLADTQIKYKYYLPQMAPNGPQNDKNAIQTLQITIFHDNSGAAQIPQIQILFAPKIAANTNRIRITRI